MKALGFLILGIVCIALSSCKKKEQVGEKVLGAEAPSPAPQVSMEPEEETVAPSADSAEPTENPATADEQVEILFGALFEGDLDTIEELIEAGADLDAREPDGATPLIAAAAIGNMDAFRALIAGGADINLPDREGNTPLLISTFFAEPEMVEVLIEEGADSTIASQDGSLPIHVAMASFEDLKPYYDEAAKELETIGVTLDYDRIRKSREDVRAILQSGVAP